MTDRKEFDKMMKEFDKPIELWDSIPNTKLVLDEDSVDFTEDDWTVCFSCDCPVVDCFVIGR